MRRNLHRCREKSVLSIILEAPINQEQNMNYLLTEKSPKKYRANQHIKRCLTSLVSQEILKD